MPMAPTRPTTIRLRDIDVAYRSAGDGRTVVLIHGLAQDHRMWAAQQEALTGVRTVAYDLRGHGATSAGDADGTLAQLGADLIALLEHVGPATCVGFSLGGTVALWAAAERPDLVPDVVALATSSVVGRAAAAFFAERIERFERGDLADVRAAVLEDTRAQTAGGDADADAIAAARLEAIGDRRGYISAARAMAALNGAPLNDRLERIRQPVLVVSGERDTFCPRRAADIMLEHLPDGRFEELPDTGHLVTDESPAAVTRVLADWLHREARA
jgi:pimeloyl-ACP methyl ester carboxylesterase